jgi:putative hydrolase of the HAD superfamily
MIRLIVFDLDGTLIDRHRPWRLCVEGFLAAHPRVFPPEVRTEFRRDIAGNADSPYLDRRVVARVLARSYPALRLSPAAIASDLADRLPGCVEPDPLVLGMLRDLAADFTTAILSNGSHRVQRAKIARAGLGGAVGRVFLSGEQGVRKPDPAIFRRVLDWAGAAPDQALMVGDHPRDDIDGGRRAGLRTCAVGTRYDLDSWPRPDLRIGRVLDLPGVLR